MAIAPEDFQKAIDEVITRLRPPRPRARRQENDFDFYTNETLTETFNQLVAMVAAATFGVCALALLVGGIGIMNIMLVSVTERTREIGVRMALGARRRRILAQFVIEAVTLSLLGGVLGVLLGGGVAIVAREVWSIPASVPAWAVLLSLFSACGAGLALRHLPRHPGRRASTPSRPCGPNEGSGRPTVDKSKVKREMKGWVFTILAVLAFRTFLYEAVYIPSGSMIPTLQIGDYVVVEKWAYGARLPFTATVHSSCWSTPERGDIVVLPQPQRRPPRRRPDQAGGRGGRRHGRDPRRPRWWSTASPVPRRRGAGPLHLLEPAGARRLARRALHRLRRGTARRPHLPHPLHARPALRRRASAPWCRPGTVFLVGDHRDHCADSRVFGPVPVDRIKGRAWVALFSWGPGGIRTDRIAHGVAH